MVCRFAVPIFIAGAIYKVAASNNILWPIRQKAEVFVCVVAVTTFIADRDGIVQCVVAVTISSTALAFRSSRGHVFYILHIIYALIVFKCFV